MRAGTRRRVALFVRALAAGLVVGAVFGGTTGSGFRDASLPGALLGVAAGALNALAIVGLVFGAEIFLMPTRFGQALERLPFVLVFALKVLVYGGATTLVVGGGLGWRAVAAAPIPLGADLAAAIAEHLQAPVAPRMARTFLPIGLAILVLQIGHLVGDRTLRDIVLGRYHRSRMEERFFLFVDIAGSTPLSERIGPQAIHRFLGEVFRLASDPIDDHGGDVHQYVGDEIVITWLVAEGRTGARPIACFFAIEQALARAAADFERDFGAVARLHAALHAGPVVTGEVGGSRRSIVYHGDVMNTASRLEQATRDLGRRFLASADALERLVDVEAFQCEDLGPQRLRGRAAPLRVYAVEPGTSKGDG
jgi:adenylate cyclase